MQIINRYSHFIILIAGLIGFVIFKIPHLSLPYYWDEAWVYGPAVRLMAQNGPGLLPDALPVHYSRGHPLLFHFLASGWLKIFGNTITVSHSFALFVSVVLIITLYYTGSKLFDKNVALASVLLLLMQPIFLAQSGLVLPEVMLALFVLLSIFFFLKQKPVLYFISATLMLFTKETGVAIVFVAFILEIFRQKSVFIDRFWLAIRILFVAGSPVLVLFAYLIVQYFYHGWLFFPDHTGYITFDPATVWNRITEGYGAYIFIYQGRNLLFFSALLLLVYGIIRKVNIEHKYELFSLCAFVLGFILVSSVNFFSNRYIMSIIPLFLLITLAITFQFFKKATMRIVFICIALVLQIPILKKQSNSDHNLGYLNAIKTNVAMVEYCKELNIKDQAVYTYFITREILSNPLSGYISAEDKYSKLSSSYSDDHDFYIFSSYDTPKDEWNLRNNPKMKLLKRFEIDKAWIELYTSGAD